MPADEEEYADDYATCALTYATLRILGDGLDVDAVTRRLGIQPTETIEGGWLLSSEAAVHSRDSRRHIDWLLDRVEPAAAALHEFQSAGCQTDIFCYWLSASGHGGPMLSPVAMGRLARLGLEVGYDAYVIGGEDNYLTRSYQAMVEFAADREAAAQEGSLEVFEREHRSVFVIVRIELADRPEIPLDAKLDVVGVYWSIEEMRERLRQLREAHADTLVRFLWKVASLHGPPPEDEPE